ncbi:hypothetical protein LINPERPRIM_LOCUS7672 [Linum perenne]
MMWLILSTIMLALSSSFIF